MQRIYRYATLQISGPIKSHVRSILTLIPNVCNEPQSDYDSPALLEYYLEHLGNVGRYVELKRDMSEVLRELGNIIVLCMQLEQALAHEEAMDFAMAAPLTDIIPPTPANGIDEQGLKTDELKYPRIHVASLVEQFGSVQQVITVLEAESLIKNRLSWDLNIFKMLLRELKGVITSDAFWTGERSRDNVMRMEERVEIHRVWSALQFFFCQPTSATKEDTEHAADPLVEAIFGDGLHWAGDTIIFLLGQQCRFEAFDFSNHLLRVQSADGKDASINGINLSKMVQRIRCFQLLNKEIFGILTTVMQVTSDSSKESVEENVYEFAPPIYQSNAREPLSHD
uniref:Cytoplasmic FMR1-interacting protein n=1 Tax=Ascaris suum TaxID=6253 RepID=F1L2B1_ASCSU